jgi:molybdate transport system substrate-binding protein
MQTPTAAPTAKFELKGISSMATKQVLAELTKSYLAKTGIAISIESVGGVDAAKRIAAGEAFAVVLLGSDAIDKLMTAGHVQQGSRVDWVQSPIAIAVRASAAAPNIASEQAVKDAVLRAPTISYSTGPSGVYLSQLFERWGMAEQLKTKLVQPPPGTSVGSLIASGKVDLGFQQLSEMVGVADIQILGNLPEEIAYITTFSSAIPSRIDTQQSHTVRGFQAFLASKEAEAIKHEQGMYWA